MEFLLAKRASNSANFVKKIILASVCASLVLTSVAQLLPEDEVQVLQTISSKLQNNYWHLCRSSCNEASGFNMTRWAEKIYSSVACDCSFNRSTVCHVTSIQLKGLNLTGSLPVGFANLSHLQEIDLSRNYLNGSIPTIFGQLRLVNFLLSANNFNGTIPVTFVNLRDLTDFRIDGSAISGKIPDFIGNWTKLDRLDMQGTSMEGPIPATISQLKNLTNLRISDLKGPSMSFSSLQDMTAMEELILRNCSIIGPIPPYLGDMN